MAKISKRIYKLNQTSSVDILTDILCYEAISNAFKRTLYDPISSEAFEAFEARLKRFQNDFYVSFFFISNKTDKTCECICVQTPATGA